MYSNVLELEEEIKTPQAVCNVAKKELTVWLVDDRPDIRQLYALLLEKHGGFRCSEQFGDPDALLSFLSRHPVPDIILLDINMGPYNGLDAIRTIKFVSPSTRVFMLTTCADPQHRDRALRDGASGFLLKSAPIEQIAEALRRPDAALPGMAVLDRPAPGGPLTGQSILNAKSQCGPFGVPQASLPEPALRWWQRSARFLSGMLG